MEYKYLSLELNMKLSDKVIAHYHFLEEDKEKLQSLYQAMLPLVRAEAFYIWNPDMQNRTIDEKADSTQALVFLTLGKLVDDFQELYLEAKCLQEAYMVECIGLELLTQAYEEFVKQVQQETNKWAVKLDFLGDNYPMDMLPKLYSQVFSRGEEAVITYTEQYLLQPKKSVVFLLPMSCQKQEGHPCHICAQCKNVECIFRQTEQEKKKERRAAYQIKQPSNVYSYGYQRIFGEQGKREL